MARATVFVGGTLLVDSKVLSGDTRGFRDPPTEREHPTWGHKAQAARRAELWSNAKKYESSREFWRKFDIYFYDFLRFFTIFLETRNLGILRFYEPKFEQKNTNL